MKRAASLIWGLDSRQARRAPTKPPKAIADRWGSVSLVDYFFLKVFKPHEVRQVLEVCFFGKFVWGPDVWEISSESDDDEHNEMPELLSDDEDEFEQLPNSERIPQQPLKPQTLDEDGANGDKAQKVGQPHDDIRINESEQFQEQKGRWNRDVYRAVKQR